MECWEERVSEKENFGKWGIWEIKLNILYFHQKINIFKSKKHLLDPKCPFLDPKKMSETSEYICILTDSKNLAAGPSIIHLPTLTLDIFALILPTSPKTHFGAKMCFF